MLGHDLRRIRNRDAYALGWGVLLTTFTFYGSDYLPPALAPCPNPSWQDVASFCIAISFGVALVEGLNWVGGFFTRDSARLADIDVERSKSKSVRGDLLIPGGWIGLVLGLVLLITPYVMHDPSQCEPLRLGRISIRYVLDVLMLGYGLLLVGKLFQEINSKISPQKPE
jgi:hypothetical protein